jgi:hypothetical protein
MEWRGLNYSGSGYRQLVGCNETSNEIWVPNSKGKLLISWEALSFSRTLLDVELEYLVKYPRYIRGSNPGGGEIFRTRPDRPWGPPNLLYDGYRV